MLRYVLLAVSALLLFVTPVPAEPAAPAVPVETDRTVVLDTVGFWRMHYTFKLPMLLRDGKAVRLDEVANQGYLRQPPWLMQETALPADGWFRADFDDASWERLPGRLAATASEYSEGKDPDTQSAYASLICARGRFSVADPAKAGDLSFSMEFRGGIVVWLNGEPVGQSHMEQKGAGGPDELALPAAPAEPMPRHYICAIPAKLLKKGVNLLAVAVHRAPLRMDEVILNGTKWPQGVEIPRSPCGIESIRLSAANAAAGAMTPNIVRPRGFQVWNSNTLATDFDMDFGDPNEPVVPIRIVGTRGGTFSGKVVAGSDAEIKGLRGVMSELAKLGGAGRIPASAAQVRYGMPNGADYAANLRYMAAVDRLDALEETPPAVVEVRVKSPVTRQVYVGEGKNRHAEKRMTSLVSSGVQPVFGAVASVWVTVSIPPDAAPGEYTGTLTVSAEGAKPVAVPVKLSVSAWRLPEPRKWETMVDMVESPETLALAYNVPMWSDAHFALIERSLKHLGSAGTRTVYLSLMCDTNLGNAETIVRWAPRADGTYDIDFKPFDRYMELVRKHLGTRPVVILYVWDKFLEREASRGQWEGGDQLAEINSVAGKGPEVTQVDPATGKTSRLQLPPYADAKGQAMWKPVSEGIRARMEKWGMTPVLGIMCDYMPSAQSIKALGEIYPGVKWVSQAHPYPHKSVADRIGYASYVFGDGNYADPSERRLYGWNRATPQTNYWRYARNDWPVTAFRYMAEFTLVRGDSGFARMGADFFPVLKDRSGRAVGSIAARYLKSYWNNLNVQISLLAKGTDGPVATARLDSMREGIEHCEARIFIERALTDKALRAKLGDDLAARAQAVLDDRTRCIRRALCTYVASGSYTDWAIGVGWQSPALFGAHWYAASGWEDRSKKLFDTAAEVAGRLDAK